MRVCALLQTKLAAHYLLSRNSACTYMVIIKYLAPKIQTVDFIVNITQALS